MVEIDKNKMMDSANEIREEFGVRVLEYNVDIRQEVQINEMMQQISTEMGTIDILVNNAGMGVRKMPQDMSLEEWKTNLSVNLDSVFICSRAAYPFMKTNGGGKIINIGSLYALFGVAKLPAYAASKGGDSYPGALRLPGSPIISRLIP